MKDEQLNSEKQRLQQQVEKTLEWVQREGATAAEVCASVDVGLSVCTRLGEVETVEHCHDKGLAITVYRGHRKGVASSSDTSDAAIQSAVKAACQMATLTEEDPCAGLPDKAMMATEWPDLELYHPWDISVAEAIEKTQRCEAYGLGGNKQICNSEGATLDTSAGLRVYGNTHGFLAPFPYTRHSMSCCLIAESHGQMQRDYSYTVGRDYRDLESDESVAKDAVQRTVAKLNPQKLKTANVPVLFHADVATGLISSFLSAINGANLYRHSSFLQEALGQQIFPERFSIVEDPFLLRGHASCPYDAEGVQVSKRQLIKEGVLQGYILNSYSARRLGMQTTGNAGGPHNVLVSDDGHSFKKLLSMLDTGLLVMDVIGQGVNLVTGDYSRGVTGFWVENGQIAYPVEEITIASNLPDMYRHIVAIGNDVEKRTSIRSGSILIDNMMVAGS